MSVKHNFTLDELQKIRQFLDTNPGMFSAVTGRAVPGRKKGKKVSEIDEGTVIEVVQPDIQEITPEQAKKLTKQKRKPRTLSDEQKAKNLEALARGREALAQKRALLKEEKEKQELPGKKVVKKIDLPSGYEGDVQTKKYIVKSKPTKKMTKTDKAMAKKKMVKDDTDTEEETTDEDIPLETTDSEGTILRKIQKKANAVKRVNEILAKNEPTTNYKYNVFRR